jgi:hypothetical protein
MTRSTFVNRRAAAIVTAALTLGFAGPAAARPFDIDAAGSFVPAGTGPVQAVAVTPTNSHTTGGGNSGLEDVLIATGGAAVALVGLGGTRAASRRRRQTGAATPPTIAA